MACVQSKHSGSLSVSSVWPQCQDYRAQEKERRSRLLHLYSHSLVAFPHRKVGWGQACINYLWRIILVFCVILLVWIRIMFSTRLLHFCVSSPQKLIFLHHQWLFNHCYHCITLLLYGVMWRVAQSLCNCRSSDLSCCRVTLSLNGLQAEGCFNILDLEHLCD